MERMAREFTVDDHKYWAKDEDDEKQSEMNQRWQDISEKMQTDMETLPGIFWIRSGLRTDSDMTTAAFCANLLC